MAVRIVSCAIALVLLGSAACSTTDDGTSDVPGTGASGSGGSAATSGGPATGGTAGTGGSTAGTGGSSASGGSDTGGGAGTGGSGGSGAGAGDAGAAQTGLSWPIDCIPDQTCVNLGYPDIDDDGIAFDCGPPGYQGHEGTDIGITFDQMAAGTAVRAAADGTVWFATDGKYDMCPNEAEPDCQNPPSYEAGAMTGTTVCTELGPYCSGGSGGSCFWCFAGGNVIVILHDGVPGVFATRYDHLKRDSVLVQPGDRVARGEKIAEVGSAGNSTGPHLHFEVWSSGYYVLAEPWAGSCGPNQGPSLWANDPPWP